MKYFASGVLIITQLLIILVIYKYFFSEKRDAKTDIKDVYDFDKSRYMFASSQNEWFEFLDDSNLTEIRFSGSPEKVDHELFVELEGKNGEHKTEHCLAAPTTHVSITNTGLLIVAGAKTIYYFDVPNKKIVRRIVFTSPEVRAAIINNNDIIIQTIDDDNIVQSEYIETWYTYRYDDAKLEKIKETRIQSDVNSESYINQLIPPRRMEYSKKYNSVYYKKYLDYERKIVAIYEMSLDTLQEKLFMGSSNFTIDAEGDLYFVFNNVIYKYDPISSKLNKVFESPYFGNIVWLKIFPDVIFFIQYGVANVKDVSFPELFAYHEGKVKRVKLNAALYRQTWDIARRDRIVQNVFPK